jgi:hypothetical protein
MVNKICNGCQKNLPYTEEFFHRNAVLKSGLHTKCKECRNRQTAIHMQSEYRDKRNLLARGRYRKLRVKVLSAYCNGEPFCRCCGEKHFEFLSLDHVNDDGAAHRREIATAYDNRAVYQWAVKNGYPDTLQVLCYNCNRAKHIYGECPHVKEKRE